MEQIIARAKQNRQRIVLPEGTEERTLKAADRVLADGVADLIIIGSPKRKKEDRFVKRNVQNDDIIITQGAGTITQVGHKLVQK